MSDVQAVTSSPTEPGLSRLLLRLIRFIVVLVASVQHFSYQLGKGTRVAYCFSMKVDPGDSGHRIALSGVYNSLTFGLYVSYLFPR